MKVDVSNVKLSQHGFLRAKERFNKNTLKDATNYFRGQLETAKYVGVIEDAETHTSCHLYANNKIAIILSLDYKTIVTVYKADTITYDPLKEKVLELHRKRFNRFTITEKAKTRKLERLRLECKVEVANCQLRSHKTKSVAVKNACVARINAIHQTLNEYEKEIEDLQNEKRRIARSMISVM